jgi:hypothetical protein
VAVDDVAGDGVDEDLRDPADLAQRGPERALLLLGVRPPVGWIREELVGCDIRVAGDPVPPLEYASCPIADRCGSL